VEEPARFVVQEDQSATPVDREHAITHVSHHVAEKHVEIPGCMSGWVGH
jgi:hypothetical protein